MSSALIVIDVQDSFLQQPIWAVSSNPGIAGRAAALADAARDRGEDVIWVLHAEPCSGGPFDPARRHVRLMDGLAARPGEPVLTKTSHNAFTTTRLPHRAFPPGRSVAEIMADPRTLHTADIITRTEYALAGRFAAIASVADLAAGATGSARVTAAR